VRGADGAEEYVGDNLGRLAVGLDLLGCWDWKGGVTKSQSTLLRLWAFLNGVDGREGAGEPRAVTRGRVARPPGVDRGSIGRAGTGSKRARRGPAMPRA